MEKHVPGRQCMGCGLRVPKGELLRIVRTPDGTVTVDAAAKSVGRGAYLCRNIECIELAKKKRSLQRALKCEIPESVYESAAREVTGEA